MSQRELARRTGKHPDVISRFAREDTEAVSYALLACICGALDCGIADLLEYVPNAEEQIGLFDPDDSAITVTNHQQPSSSLKAAETQPRYGGANPTSRVIT
jgi:DNA-binding Xre family transcriptional regulator